GLHVLADETSPGTVRLIIISLGEAHAVASSGDLAALVFTVKDTAASSSLFNMTDAVVADGNGQELTAETEGHEVYFLRTDLNGDGKVSIGDLAIVGRYYGLSVSDYPEAAA